MATLRVIIDPPAAGAWNMAVDETLLLSNEDNGPTLRFYEWHEPTLSLGYFQALSDRDQHLASVSCPVVRRASGGGAIVHDQELTYSLIAPTGQHFGSHAQELYALAHQSLCDVLADWNIRAERFAPGGSDLIHLAEPFLCFQRRSPGDVLLGEHKICGSAQRRHLSRVLQHGSVLLNKSIAAPELSGIHDLVASAPELASLRGAWLARLVHLLRVDVEPSGLFVQEQAIAEAIAEGKFRNPNWISRR